MSLFLVLFTAALIYYIFKFYENVRRYPKGPFPLPGIGNLHKFNPSSIHLFFEKCYQEYGSIFTVFTPRPIVIIMDYEHIKEAFVTKGDDFIGRSNCYPDTLFQNIENGGVIFSQGDNWREQRRVSLHILRDFGLGKNIMENQVMSSVEDFMEHLDTLDIKRIEFRWPIQILVANVINNLLFGFRYRFDDCSRLMKIGDLLNYQMETLRKNPLVLLANYFPVVEKVPLVGWYAVGQYKHITGKIRQHIVEDIERCRETFSAENEPESFVHAYLQKIKMNDYLDEDNLVNVCMDFFLAGMETTSTTLRWAMIHMANEQEVQEKIREEIHAVIGKERLPSMADRPRLPYTVAAVSEMQRVANILPTNVPHRTVADTEVAGHAIPDNTIVIGQLYHVLRHSPMFSDSPESFRPERFLEKDGKTAKKAALEQLIPFSLGRRQCAGEGLARMELFLGLAAILQRYRVRPPLDDKLNLEPIVGMAFLPPKNLLNLEKVA